LRNDKFFVAGIGQRAGATRASRKHLKNRNPATRTRNTHGGNWLQANDTHSHAWLASHAAFYCNTRSRSRFITPSAIGRGTHVRPHGRGIGCQHVREGRVPASRMAWRQGTRQGTRSGPVFWGLI
jgi:hypothetical protein